MASHCKRSLILALTLLGGSTGCGASETTVAPGAAEPRTDDAPCQRPTIPRQAWRHTHLGTLLSGVDSAEHAADDVVIPAGTAATVAGRFTYTALHKDLEREEIVTLLAGRAGCATTRLASSLTDSDGRAEATTPPLPAGQYPYFMLVPGDGTSADGMIWAIEPGTKAVLFDIDGTLTTSDGELFEDLLGGNAEMFPDANAVVQRWADAGYLIIYVTGRPNFLRNHTRQWLSRNKFAPGALFTVNRLRDTRPTAGGVGTFKAALINQLRAAGVQIERAYGNAGTDACAYLRNGIDPSRVFMTGNQARSCDSKSTQPMASYTAHLANLVVPPR